MRRRSASRNGHGAHPERPMKPLFAVPCAALLAAALSGCVVAPAAPYPQAYPLPYPPAQVVVQPPPIYVGPAYRFPAPRYYGAPYRWGGGYRHHGGHGGRGGHGGWR
jgi:hypothetical protein